MMKQLAKNLLKKTPIHTLYMRYFYTRKISREFSKWTENDERRFNFYKQLINPGDLVFDVGANLGNRTKAFLKLGAHVVAFEPQRMCADFLEAMLKNDRHFKLVKKALGPQ